MRESHQCRRQESPSGAEHRSQLGDGGADLRGPFGGLWYGVLSLPPRLWKARRPPDVTGLGMQDATLERAPRDGVGPIEGPDSSPPGRWLRCIILDQARWEGPLPRVLLTWYGNSLPALSRKERRCPRLHASPPGVDNEPEAFTPKGERCQSPRGSKENMQGDVIALTAAQS